MKHILGTTIISATACLGAIFTPVAYGSQTEEDLLDLFFSGPAANFNFNGPEGNFDKSFVGPIQEIPAAAGISRAFSSKEVVLMVKDMLDGYNIPDEYVNKAFAEAADPKTFPEIPRLFGPGSSKPSDPKAQRKQPSTHYRQHVLTKANIANGVNFVNTNKDTLMAVEKEFGVDHYLLTALIGVETRFGTVTGKYVVFDALNTVAQKVGRRSLWAAREMAELIEFSYMQNKDPRELLGSYAGAFGYVQFMPSSYNARAVDFDRDGKADLYKWPDAIASCANYLAKAGYSGTDFSLNSPIGDAIYNYNHSSEYIMSILDLRAAIKNVIEPKPVVAKPAKPQKKVKPASKRKK